VAMVVMAGCGVGAGLAVSAESIRTLAMVGPVAVAAMADGCSVAVALAGPAEPARSPVAAVTGAPVALLSGCGGWVVTAARVATVLSIWQAVLV
ncbi:hypothetical protein OSH34_25280, partial [Mycobacterium ulcerans]